MKNCILLIFLFFIFHAIYSQTIEAKLYKNQIRWSAFRMLDPINPGLEIGYERMFKGKYSTQLSYAIMRDYAKVSKYKDFDGIRLSLEQKFFYEIRENLLYFHAVEFVYSHNTFKYEVSYIKRDSYAHTSDPDSYLDIYTLDKWKYILNYKTGFQKSLNHFMFEMTAGLGLKYRTIIHSDKNEIRSMYRESIVKLLFGNPPTDEGEILTWSLPINVKFAYLF